jgi:hypothetical protein
LQQGEPCPQHDLAVGKALVVIANIIARLNRAVVNLFIQILLLKSDF